MKKTDLGKLFNNLGRYTSKDITKSSRLHEVYMMLTLECNLKCSFCCWWGPNGSCRNSDFFKKFNSALSLGEMKRFIDEIRHFNPAIVNLSGGEPLLCDTWHSIARHIRSKGVQVSLTTNGLLLFKEARKIHNTIDELNISFQGASAGMLENYLEKLKKGLNKLALIKKREKNGPKVKILYTLTEQTCGLLNDFTIFLSKIKLDIDSFIFQHQIFISKEELLKQQKTLKKYFNEEKTDFSQGFLSKCVKMDFNTFKKQIYNPEITCKHKFAPELLPAEIEPYYLKKKIPIRFSSFCSAPWHQVNFLPNGDIYTCHDYILGNIKNKSFESVWNGRRAVKMRRFISKRLLPVCKGCFYFYTDKK